MLLFGKKFVRKKIDYIWFPTINEIESFVQFTMGETACPIVSGTPRVVYSAFTKESDLFAKAKVAYIDDTLTLTDRVLMKKQLFDTWGSSLKLTRDESNWALEQAWKIQQRQDQEMMQKGRVLLDTAELKDEIVILLLGRPYHSDPGINHEILDEFQNLGFKTLSMRAIPTDEAYLKQYFDEDLQQGYIQTVMDIRDVWAENFSTNSAQKVWAAKFAARHRNVAALDISSFKCGHDAPTYSIIDKILGASRTPHLTLHDVDANKPGGSIKIRVKTFAYTLEQYK